MGVELTGALKEAVEKKVIEQVHGHAPAPGDEVLDGTEATIFDTYMLATLRAVLPGSGTNVLHTGGKLLVQFVAEFVEGRHRVLNAFAEKRGETAKP